MFREWIPLLGGDHQQNTTPITPMKALRSHSRKPALILTCSLAALLVVQSAKAATTINPGQTFDIDNSNTTVAGNTRTFNDPGPITIFNDGTLQVFPDQTDFFTPFSDLILTGAAGTVTLRFNNNDTDYQFSGSVTSTSTGAQTLAIETGFLGNGDRESVTFVQGIPNAGANPLSLNVRFTTQTGSESYVNLNGNNGFTGPITLEKGDNVNSAYLTIGGVLTRNGNTVGSGSLGNGSYAGAISLDTNTILHYDSTATQILSGVISGAGTVVKGAGTGTVTLTGNNTYTGPTRVEGGTLILGVGGSIAQSSTINLFSGTTLDVTALGAGYQLVTGQTLTGSNDFAVAGTMTVNSGATIEPGGSSAIGTLTVGGLTLSAGSIANFQFNGDPNNDLVNVTGANGLVINGGGVNLYEENSTTAFAAAGTYNLFQYSGAAPTVSNLSVLNPLAGFRYGFSTAASNVILTIGPGPTWTGGGADNNWSSAADWTVGPIIANDKLVFDGSVRLTNVNDVAQPVTQFASLVFKPTAGDGTNGFAISGEAITLISDSDGYLIRNDTPTVTHTIDLPITVAGAGKTITTSSASGATVLGGAINNNGNTVIVNGAGQTTISATGTIAGSGGITKNGTGTLAINAATTYTGTTKLSAGAIQVGDSSALQQTTVDMQGGTLDLNGLDATLGGLKGNSNVAIPAAKTISVGNNNAATQYDGVLGGGGTLEKVGSGTFTLTSAQAYLGNTVISGGTLKLLGLNYAPGLTARFVDGDDSGPISQQNTFNAWLPTRTQLLLTTTVAGPNPPSTLRYPDNDGKFTGLGFPDRDNYTVSMTGAIKITTAGTYQFALDSDDGSMLWINGVEVVSNNNYQGMHGENDPSIFQVSGSISLAAGYHNIQIGMYEGGGGDGLNVSYNGADTTNNWVYVPNAVLGVLTGSVTENILPTTTHVSMASGTTLHLNAVDQEIASLADVVGASGHTVVLAGATLTVGDGATDTTFSGAITAGANPPPGDTSAFNKVGTSTLRLDGAQSYNSLTVSEGTLNVNGAVGTNPNSGSAAVTVAGGATLKFGSVSQTLSSLTIGAGATVTFTSGPASFSGGGGKGASYGATSSVPEPGTIGLLLVAALGVLNRRRRQA